MSKWIFSFAILISLFGCTTRTSDTNRDKAEYLHEIGTSFLVRGRLQDALRNLLEAKRLNPQLAQVRNNLGLTYFAMKKYDLALPEFEEALKLQPQYTDARNNLGGLYVALGKHEDALKQLLRASQDLTYHRLDKVYNNIGLVHYRRNNFEKAQEAFQNSLIYNGENCQALTFLGRAYYSLEKYPNAVESLDRAVQSCKGPYKEESFFYSGLSLLKTGNKEKAAGRFREVLGNYPKGTYAKKAQELLEIIR